MLIGVPAGIVSARYHNTAVDQSFMGLALLGLSIPNFLLGLLMILVFGVWLRLAAGGRLRAARQGLWPNARSLLMPSVSLGLVQSALIARITRSSMLDVLREQYILAGRAKGLAERAVVYKHALKNAIIPTLTVIGITFAHPGRGRGGDRDRVQHPGAGAPHHLGGAAPRLPGDPGRGAAHRRHLHPDQPARWTWPT